MKIRHTIAVMSVVFLVLSSQCAYAHPPSKISINHDKPGGTLDCVVLHRVSDPQKYFIKRIVTGINGKVWMTKDLDKQDNQNTQELMITNKGIKPGDVISASAECNLYGKLAEKIEIK